MLNLETHNKLSKSMEHVRTKNNKKLAKIPHCTFTSIKRTDTWKIQKVQRIKILFRATTRSIRSKLGLQSIKRPTRASFDKMLRCTPPKRNNRRLRGNSKEIIHDRSKNQQLLPKIGLLLHHLFIELGKFQIMTGNCNLE